jgi:hypothetical protein
VSATPNRLPWIHISRGAAGVAAVAVAVVLVILLNEPVGSGTQVLGTVEGNCVPRGRQSNFFDCGVKLSDGTRLLFRELHQFQSGTRVTFICRNRKYFGRDCQFSRVAPLTTPPVGRAG